LPFKEQDYYMNRLLQY